MVQAAVADVEGPAVSADAPDALLGQIVGGGKELAVAGIRPVLGDMRLHPGLEFGHPCALAGDLRLVFLPGGEHGVYQFGPKSVLEPVDQFPGELGLLVHGEPEPVAELGRVLE